MSALLSYPRFHVGEIEQLKRDVAEHQREVEAYVVADRVALEKWAARDFEIGEKLRAIRQRLVALYA